MRYDFDSWKLSVVSIDGKALLAVGAEVGPLAPMNEPTAVQGQAVQFFDTNRLRVFEVVSVLEDEPDVLRFVDPVGRVVEIRPLTLERYRAEFQAKLVGAPDVANMRELERLLFGTL